jgi:hypothetical protein
MHYNNTRTNWVPTSSMYHESDKKIIAIPPAYGSIDIDDPKQCLVGIYDSHACYCCVYWIPTKCSAMIEDSDKDNYTSWSIVCKFQ